MRAAWFSADPDRRWAEKFFLAYSPVWMVAIGIVMLTRVMQDWGDFGWLTFGLLIALPPVALPFFLAPTAGARAYAARFNLWVWSFAFAGNYFFTRYVTDLFGLHYRVATVINLGAIGVGANKEPIPFVMFLLTQAYFLTYYTLIFLLWRRLGKRWPVMVFMCLAVAFAETASMASPLIKDIFWYENKTRMLTWGTLCYGSGFIISAPLLNRLRCAWPWPRVLLDSLAAVAIQFYVYEAWSWLLA